jgi:hypothetical protein
LLIAIALLSACSYSVVSLVLNIQKSWPPLDIDTPMQFNYRISNLSNFNENNYASQLILAILCIILLVLIPIASKFSHRILRKFYFKNCPFQYTQPLALLFKLEKPFISETDIINTINHWYQIERQNNPKLGKK